MPHSLEDICSPARVVSTEPDRFDKEPLPRTLVCSIPKAGTYFLAELLAACGGVNTRLHVSKHEFSDYGSGSLEMQRRYPEQFQVRMPLAQCLSQIDGGEFALSHLPCDAEVCEVLVNCKVVFLYRDLRDCVISYMRFLASTGRDNSAASEWIRLSGTDRLVAFLELYSWFFEAAAAMLKWTTHPAAIAVSYEALAGDGGPQTQVAALLRVCEHIGRPSDASRASRILADCQNKNTLTWSGKRTLRSEFWSSRAEELFISHGGQMVNKVLGYQ